MRKSLSLIVFLLSVSISTFAVEIEREIFPSEIKKGQECIVSLKINKQGEEGFAKLMETIPEGFRAVELNSATGNFIYEEGKLRIIWLTMPEGDSFNAEYKLVYDGDEIGDFKLNGKFYYVKNGKRSEYKLAFSSIKVLHTPEKEPVIINTPEVVAEKVKDEVVATAKPAMEEVVVVVVVVDKKDSVTEVIPEINELTLTPEVKEEVIQQTKPVTKSGVVFKVQLGVFSTEKSMNTFGSLQAVHFDKVGDFYKYYSGKFSSEADARANIKNAQEQGFTGAFLVRFKDGKKL
jgi:hypothetical protein